MMDQPDNLDEILDQFGIRCIPTRQRRRHAGETHACAALRVIYDQCGEEHLVAVLRCMRDTRNREELWSDTIGALSDVLVQRPEWMEDMPDLILTLEGIDLGAMRAKAIKLRPWPIRHTMRASLYQRMSKHLDRSNSRNVDTLAARCAMPTDAPSLPIQRTSVG